MIEDFMPKPAEETAEFNNAFAFLERLNQIEYMIEGNLMQWRLIDAFSALESYENELCFSFKGTDQEDVNKIKRNIINLFNKYPNLGKKGKDARGKPCMVGGSKNGEVRNLLIELNKKLRHIKYKKGMGMPSKGEGKLF